MTLLGFWGFDDTMAEEDAAPGSISTGRSGYPVSAGYSAGRVLVSNLDPLTEGVVGVAIRPNNLNLGSSSPLLALREGATNHLYLRLLDEAYALYRGTDLLIASTHVPAVGMWSHHEIKFGIDEAAGFAEWRINGSLIGSYGGDTQNGQTGVVNAIWGGWTGGAGNSFHLDDLVLLDLTDATATQGQPFNDFLGDVQVITVRPTGNGAANEWVGSDGDSIDNYLLVDEQPTSTSDYVTSDVAARDLYQVDFPVGSVGSVQVLAAQTMAALSKADAGASPDVTLISQVDGTERIEAVVASESLPLSPSYQKFAGMVQATDPSGQEWDLNRAIATQVGVRVE